ncbi:MAG: TetR/AcrR family transcriptional regulator [Gemmatimonadetes bacterium]|nr:TetR/AcrR family transcriptional regulator [Gemmatimonadota bacterium]
MELRDRILEAAAQVYSETGFRGATTRRIAERAHVNEITLFRHFGSKTRLLHEAIQCASSSTPCALPTRSANPRGELRVWALANHHEMFERRFLIRTAMGEMEERPDIFPMDRSQAVCAGLELKAYLERLQAEHLIAAEIDLRAATTMFMGTLFADAISRDILPSMYPDPPEISVDQYLDLFARALALKEPLS